VAPEQRIRAGYGVARLSLDDQSSEPVWSAHAEQSRRQPAPLLATASPVSYRPAWLPAF
jgi:hypothetical protein